MKFLSSTFAALAVLVSGSLRAQSLVGYDFGNVGTHEDRAAASYCAPCIEPSDLYACSLVQCLRYGGGPDGSNFRSYSGWDVSPNYDTNRDGLWQWPYTLAFDVVFDAGANGSIGNLSLDWQRPDTGGPGSIQAAIFWKDGAGNVQHRISGAETLALTGTWNQLEFDWTDGSAALPDGSALGGGVVSRRVVCMGGVMASCTWTIWRSVVLALPSLSRAAPS